MKIWSHWIGVSLNPMTGVFIRRGKSDHRDVHIGFTGKIHRKVLRDWRGASTSQRSKVASNKGK